MAAILVNTCDPNTIKHEIPCAVQCLGRDQLITIRLYLLTQILVALFPQAYGDYTLQDWEELLSKWQNLSPVELEAAEIANMGTFAEAAGVEFTSDQDALMAAMKCFLCVPKATQLQMIGGLECIFWNALAGGFTPN